MWLDSSCRAIRRATRRRSLKKATLDRVDRLYLGTSVLILSRDYRTRFWTQFEAWASMHASGLVSAPPAERRCAIELR